MKNFFFYWLPVLLYSSLIYILSSRSSIPLIPPWPLVDKVLHFGAYVILGALFSRAFQTTLLKTPRRNIVFLSIFFSSLYGLSDEIHQYFVPYRDADIMDVAADIAGSVCGALGYESLDRILKSLCRRFTD
ncbi:MAG: VanZ family protein [Desulfobacterales bacterium]|nr:VanZ family protein [Desulfobacterales bacterium]